MALRSKSKNAFEKELRSVGFDPKVDFRPYVIRRVLAVAAEACSDDLTGALMTARDLKQAADLALQMIPNADRSPQNLDERDAAILRMQQEQIHDLVGYGYYLRELSLALRAQQYASGSGLDLDADYRRSYGFTLAEMIVMSLAIWGAVTSDGKEGFFQPPLQHPQGPERLPIGEEAPANFQERLSTDRVGFARSIRERTIQGFEVYTPSPLFLTPLIRHDDEELSIPVPDDLLERPVRLFYEDSLTGSDDSQRRSRIADAISKSYMEHVRDSLRSIYGPDRVLNAEKALPTVQGRKVCDFICVGSSRLLFVEVKTNRFSDGLTITKSASGFANEAEKRRGLAHAVEQIADSIETYHGTTHLGLPKNLQVMGLIVVAGESTGLNSARLRDAIGNAFPSEKQLPRFEIVDDRGLDALTTWGSSGRRIEDLLWRKSHNRAHQHDDTEAFLARQGNDTAHPLLATYRRRLDELVKTFDKDPTTPPDG